MEDYNFCADVLDTYRSLPIWLKGLWLVIPPAFVLGLIRLFLRWRAGRAADTIEGELIYSIYTEPDGIIRVYRFRESDDRILEALIERQPVATVDPRPSHSPRGR